MDAQPLLGGYGEVRGGLSDPLSEVGATHLWPSTGNTCGPNQGELQYPIGSVVGVSSTPPTPPQDGHTHSPTCVIIQTVAEGGVPWGEFEDPPTDGALAVSSRNFTAHVEHRGDPTGFGMECLGPNPKRDHQHMGHRPARDPVEVGGGYDRHPSTRKPPVS